MSHNLILKSDSYKLTHHRMYREGTEVVYSYLEARKGAEYDEVVFFGLQKILETLEGEVITAKDIREARALCDVHIGPGVFNFEGWMHILETHQGRLPITIKALPEGTVVRPGVALLTIENTDPECFWLTNFLESLILHVWYPITVASKSRAIKQDIKKALDHVGADLGGLDFMLQDFGYRGATSDEAAAIGGAAHLVNFKGTDTLVALELIQQTYGGGVEGFSVNASEHSIMTAGGREGEWDVLDNLIAQYPTGILSIVADSYNIYEHTRRLGGQYKDQIMARTDGPYVERPDSTTPEHPTPEALVVWIVSQLWLDFGGEIVNDYRLLDPHIRVLWGDGIDREGIKKILWALIDAGFSPLCVACFGMGGGLLQKVNRDDLKMAIKSSAQRRHGRWHDVYKEAPGKFSKRGRLKNVLEKDGIHTVQESNQAPDQLVEVFRNGEILIKHTFDGIRERAKI